MVPEKKNKTKKKGEKKCSHKSLTATHKRHKKWQSIFKVR